jgi:hypothetical protein
MGQRANMTHFVVFFISFQDIVTLKLPLGQTGIIGDSNDYYLVVRVSQIFVKNQRFLPQNAQTVFELSVMNIYDMY